MVEPNASLSGAGAWRFLAVMAIGALGVAGWFTAHGFWPVMLFAVANLAGLGLALVLALRHNAYREVLSFGEDTLEVAFGFSGRGVAFRVRLPRRQARAMLEPGPYASSPVRLVLRCGAQHVEVGRDLTDRERVDLCTRIRGLLQPGWERKKPALPASADAGTWGC